MRSRTHPLVWCHNHDLLSFSGGEDAAVDGRVACSQDGGESDVLPPIRFGFNLQEKKSSADLSDSAPQDITSRNE